MSEPSKNSLSAIHVDDHFLYSSAIFQILSEKFTFNFYQKYKDSQSAIDFLIECLNTGTRIDFIITDLCHLDTDGYEFAKKVREIESGYGVVIPIFLITMHSKESTKLISDGLEKGYFSYYLQKNSNSDKVIEVIQKMIV